MRNLVFLFALMLLLCGGCKYFKKSTPKSVDIMTADSDSTAQTMDSSAYYAPGNAEIAAEPTQQPIQTASAVAGKYYMIVGCFTVSSNADKYAEKMQGLGYEAEILPGPANFRMVAARSYGSYRESVADLDKFRNDVTANAWVYRQK